jgi:hypothetical protein
MAEGDYRPFSSVEEWQAHIDDGYANYDFHSADAVFGAEGVALVAWWARALAERALIHPDHYGDLAREVVVEFATTPVPTMHFALGGRESWREEWGSTVDDAREYLVEALPDYAGQIKADRGYDGGHHPWDDPVDA